jgi:hypothetical protein
MYIGYIDFDTDQWRAKMERLNDPPIEEVSYQLFASGEVKDHLDIHCRNVASERFDLNTAKQIAKDYNLKLSKDRRKYEVYQPDENSSEIYLREIGGKATIK